MHITLICPPWYSMDTSPITSNNLGLGYIGAYLIQHGHRVEIIDGLSCGNKNAVRVSAKYQRVYQIGLDYDEIVSRIPTGTDMIGITAPFVNHAQIIRELSLKIKARYPNTPLVLGGAYPSTMPEHALSQHIDFVVIGEGEIPMLELASGISPEKIQGLYYQGKEQVSQTSELQNLSTSELYCQGEQHITTATRLPWSKKQARVIENLDGIPYPARHLLPVEKYLYADALGRSSRKRSLEIMTSRGCPFKCTFCATHPVFGYKWRARSVSNIIPEIKQLISDYDIQHINFIDDNISLDSGRMNSLLDGLIKENLGITWSAVSGLRISTLNKELLEKIKASGGIRINLAVESGDSTILDAMNKRLDVEKTKEIVGICGKLDLSPRGYLMVGYPGETRESFLKSIKFCEELKTAGMNTFILSIAQPYPKTSLWEMCKKQGYLVRDDIENVLFFSEYPEPNIITPDFDQKEIYFRFKYAKRRLNPLEYWGEKILPRAWIKQMIPKELKDRIVSKIPHSSSE
ncbi:B12-binding domain-containing radical SAM protein [Candidatus Desantisbacteria bacterium]|nr:B12-binding domain-containing radical SAM protein [Candidatus Desantisbacteria bacterium]